MKFYIYENDKWIEVDYLKYSDVCYMEKSRRAENGVNFVYFLGSGIHGLLSESDKTSFVWFNWILK